MWKITAAFLLFVLLAVNGENEMKKPKESKEICPFGWKKYERQCYKLFKIRKPWNEAEKQCVVSKGHLASVHKPAVNAFLKNIVRVPQIWIGGYYATQKAAWTWSDGSKFGYTNWNAKPVIARNKKDVCSQQPTKVRSAGEMKPALLISICLLQNGYQSKNQLSNILISHICCRSPPNHKV